MKRAIILVLDSFGIGAASDAALYGDEGANTFLNIRKHSAPGTLQIPHLENLGLLAAAGIAENSVKPSMAKAKYGSAEEISRGKDTQSGHFEIAGLPVLFEWGYFKDKENSFPQPLIDELIAKTSIKGALGLCHASGTQIIEALGARHIKTQKPIIYTSADSVFQIAAHEKYFGLEKLYQVCEVARRLVDAYHIGRVIARPFIGEPGHFSRTAANRKDYATPPHGETLLDKVIEANGQVVGIGKIADIFAHKNISYELKAENNHGIFDQTLKAMKETSTSPSLIFSNFVDFDSAYGHRRDVNGYAKALSEFDSRLAELFPLLCDEDLVIITADHGCDPTFKGTDHTRERIPILAFGPSIRPEDIGCRQTFSDIGQSVAKHLQIAPLQYGQSFI